ncbi:MAG: hypothetical protein HQL52_05500 [Magnetococcales bacterium]|nr:hypothetical protein [Magnetococcales bacterium]
MTATPMINRLAPLAPLLIGLMILIQSQTAPKRPEPIAEPTPSVTEPAKNITPPATLEPSATRQQESTPNPMMDPARMEMVSLPPPPAERAKPIDHAQPSRANAATLDAPKPSEPASPPVQEIQPLRATERAATPETQTATVEKIAPLKPRQAKVSLKAEKHLEITALKPREEIPTPTTATTSTITPLAAAKKPLATQEPPPPYQRAPLTPLKVKSTPSTPPALKEREPLAPRKSAATRADTTPTTQPLKPLTPVQPREVHSSPPKPTPSPPTRTIQVTHRSAETVAGRTLLRLLEHGSGPAIEIAWPNSSTQKERLGQILGRCYGMRIAVMTGSGLYTKQGSTSGTPWQIDPDRYSAFIRQSLNGLAPGERSEARTIRNRHGISAGRVVRIFPRIFDAALLGGLSALVGDSFSKSRHIEAHYVMQGSQVVVKGVLADGRSIPGVIAFPSNSGSCRG